MCCKSITFVLLPQYGLYIENIILTIGTLYCTKGIFTCLLECSFVQQLKFDSWTWKCYLINFHSFIPTENCFVEDAKCNCLNFICQNVNVSFRLIKLLRYTVISNLLRSEMTKPCSLHIYMTFFFLNRDILLCLWEMKIVFQ